MFFTKDDVTIEYNVIFSKRKNIEFKMDTTGILTMKAPKGMKMNQVLLSLDKKWDWILNCLHKVSTINASYKKRCYTDGERITILGFSYKLNIHHHDLQQCKIKKVENELILQVPSDFKTEDFYGLMEAYFKIELKKYLVKRIQFYEEKLHVSTNKISVRNQSTRWGSCSSGKNISINYRLIMAPLEVIDYIIVHEICHLEHMNHSKAFWMKVEEVMPDYKHHEMWLKHHGHLLSVEIMETE